MSCVSRFTDYISSYIPDALKGDGEASAFKKAAGKCEDSALGADVVAVGADWCVECGVYPELAGTAKRVAKVASVGLDVPNTLENVRNLWNSGSYKDFFVGAFAVTCNVFHAGANLAAASLLPDNMVKAVEGIEGGLTAAEMGKATMESAELRLFDTWTNSFRAFLKLVEIAAFAALGITAVAAFVPAVAAVGVPVLSGLAALELTSLGVGAKLLLRLVPENKPDPVIPLEKDGELV